MLRLVDIEKSFRLGTVTVEVLQGVDLEVAAGDLLSIMGPSGSGKSALMNIIGLLLGCTDAHRCWSLDHRFGRIQGTREVPLWNLLILQFQVEVILVFAGLVKIEVDWLRGEPLRTRMLDRDWSPLSPLFEVHWITLAAPVLIILLHTVGAPTPLWSKARIAALELEFLKEQPQGRVPGGERAVLAVADSSL